VHDPYTQIAAGLEQLVTLTRARFGNWDGGRSTKHDGRPMCEKVTVDSIACRIIPISADGVPELVLVD
jgi:hypothetical protein